VSYAEEAPVSYLRAVREVVPNKKLGAFLADAQTLSNSLFGYEQTRNLQIPVDPQQELQPGYVAGYEGVGVPTVETFAVTGLRATLFERRARASEQINEVLARAAGRITATRIRSSGRPRHTETGGRVQTYRANTLPSELSVAQEARGLGETRMSVHTINVIDSTQLALFDGVEYALEIDPVSSAAIVLRDQACIITKHVKKTVAGRPLVGSDINFETERSPLVIPFIRIPGHVAQHNPAACERFLDAMQQRADLGAELRPVEWQQTLRPPV
jgi:hypothetical protein